MPDDINVELVQAKERLRKLKRCQRMLPEARKQLQDKNQKLAQLSEVLKREQLDVQKLEESSLSALFYQFLGSKERKLDRERSEALSAKLNYDSCKRSVAGLEREINDLERAIAGLGDPQSDYERIIKEKERTLSAHDKKRWLDLTDRIANLNSESAELSEAHTAGENLLSELEKTVSFLKSARNWGTFDLLGGGLIATAVKHSKIDDAKRAIERIQVLLNRFQRELSDVNIDPESDIAVAISSFDTFADYFFDGLIFDWIVQAKIDRSLKGTERMRSDITGILETLQRRSQNVARERERAEEEKKQLVENA